MEARSVSSVIDLTGDDENPVLASESLASTPNGMQSFSSELERRRQDLLRAFQNSTSAVAGQSSRPAAAISSVTGIQEQNELSLGSGNSARAGEYCLDCPGGLSSSNLPPPVSATCIAASGKGQSGHKETSGQAACHTELEKPSGSMSSPQIFSAIRDVINVYRGVLSEDERRSMGAQIARRIIGKSSIPSPNGQSEEQERYHRYRKLARIHASQLMKQKVDLSGKNQKTKMPNLNGMLTGHKLETEHKQQQLKSPTSIQEKPVLAGYIGELQGRKDNGPSNPIHRSLGLKRTSDRQVKMCQEDAKHSSPPHDHVKSTLDDISLRENRVSCPPAVASRLRGESSSSQFLSRVEDKQTSKVIAYPQVIVELPPRNPKVSRSASYKEELPIASKLSVTQCWVSDIPSTLSSSSASTRVLSESGTSSEVHHSEVKTKRSDCSAGKDTVSNSVTTTSLSTQHNRTHSKSKVDHPSAGSKRFTYHYLSNQHTAGETASSIRGSPSRESFSTPTLTSRGYSGRRISLESEATMVLPLPSATNPSGRVLRPRRARPSANAQVSTSEGSNSLRPSSNEGHGGSKRERESSTSPGPKRAGKRSRLQGLTQVTAQVPTQAPAQVPIQNSTQDPKIPRSFLSGNEQHALQKEQSELARGEIERAGHNDQFKHVDFSAVEMLQILPIIIEQRNLVMMPNCVDHGKLHCLECVRYRVICSLRTATQRDMAKIVKQFGNQPGRKFIKRSDDDIQAFLMDASTATISMGPASLAGASVHQIRAETNPTVDLHRQIYLRQMGIDNLRHSRSSPKTPSEEIKTNVYDSLKLSRNWTVGGSSDVMSVMWGPDGNTFAAGCAALTDSNNMQYNRCNNLLLGNFSGNVVRELPDHRRPRVRPASGPNAAVNMFNAMDPWLYYTVSSVDFSPSGHRMYTGSYDKTVKVWDVDRETARGRLLNTFEHEAVVDDVCASLNYPHLIATGSNTIKDSVRIYRISSRPGSGTKPLCKFSSQKAVARPQKEIYPSCVRWGPLASVQHFVLAGYASNVGEEGKPSRDGDLCLFDVEKERPIKVTPSAQNIFDCVWHPSLPWFAVGCAADSRGNRGTGSYVRLYRSIDKASHELECPALDMNEITWCPDYYYCTASCTNGSTYVWDLRKYQRILHVLKHGDPIQELPPSDEPWRVRKERYDTGVRFAHWGDTSARFYTGSSDGVVKVWDIKRATENAHVKDLVQLESGVMCGSFTKDHSKLLLGDTQGQLSILTTEMDDGEDPDSEVGTFNFKRAATNDAGTAEDEAFDAAGERLENQQMVRDRSHGLRPEIRGTTHNGPVAANALAEKSKREQESAPRKIVADKGKSGIETKEVDSKEESTIINEDKNNELENHGGDQSGAEVVDAMEVDSDEERVKVVEVLLPGWRSLEHQQDYEFDCGIFSRILLPTDIKKKKVSQDGGCGTGL